MTETIQQLKEDIAILQQKLEHLEKPKSDVEEAYKEVYGCYPPTTPSVSNSEDERWSAFQKGYNASKEDCKRVEEPKPPTLLHIVCEWCDDDIDLPCGELVNMIEQWLPGCKKGVGLPEYHLGWNEALRTIKEKLR